MTSPCPICGKPVDSLRAPAVGVRSGKVVAYCSRECAAAAETKPTRIPAQLVEEDTRLPPPEIDEETAARAAAEVTGEPSDKRDAKDKSDKRDAKDKSDKRDAKRDAKADKRDAKDKRATPAGGVPTDKRASTPAGGVPTKHATPAGGVPTKRATPAGGVSTTDSRLATPSGGVQTSATRPSPVEGGDKAESSGKIKQTAADFESAPVIEILHEPASGVVTSAPDRRVGKDDEPKPKSDRKTGPAAAIPAPRGPFATGSFILESDDPDFEVEAEKRPRSKAFTAFLVFVLLVVAGGALGYKYLYLEHRWIFAKHQPATPAALTPKPTPAPVTTAADAGSGLTPQSAVDRAQTVLRSLLRKSSPRVQQKAALALARTRDPEAVKWLADALASETERAPKMDIAYALGRAGDKRGPDALAALLTSDRDARLYAAKKLAQLHDKRAVATLVNYLSVSQNRLGVAAWLAPFDEPQALKALDEARNDPKSPDKQAEAAIALGTAKHAEATPQLRELLKNPDWKGPAARALAELHDPAARPVLVEQLASAQLRVDGALALRRLEPNLDAKPLIEPLVAALDLDKDVEQISVAETILLLAGPANLAEFD
jgi:hypothetical protein